MDTSSLERPFADRTWQSADGLTLHYRDYPARNGADPARPSTRPPVICLHGLTRNARDFESLAEHIAGDWRVLVPEMRGRGDSDYSPDPDTYSVPTYVADVLALLEAAGIDRFVSIGTSMGGIITMMLALLKPQAIAGTVLNDVGPQLETAGLDAIKGYVGQGRSFPTWMHAARALEDAHGAAFPGFDTEQWIAMAKRTLVLCNNGRISFDYDMKIAEPILAADANAVPPDMWPAFEALAGRPLLILRGELSTLFSAQTLAAMQARIPQARTVIVPQTGHAPTLDEPEARTAIDAFLAQIA